VVVVSDFFTFVFLSLAPTSKPFNCIQHDWVTGQFAYLLVLVQLSSYNCPTLTFGEDYTSQC
jgi:hypothetical protein